MAVRSGLYTPSLVEAIGQAIVHATVNEGDVTAIDEPDKTMEPVAGPALAGGTGATMFGASGAGCALEPRFATPEAERGAVRMEIGTGAPQG
eukprot:13590303-Heterocapsa_arctica.AAC.1